MTRFSGFGNRTNRLRVLQKQPRLRLDIQNRFIVTKSFLLNLKAAVSFQNVLLEHPEKCIRNKELTISITHDLLKKCSIEELSPTASVLCVRDITRSDGQKHGNRCVARGKEDLFFVSSELWQRILECFPNAVAVLGGQPECRFCKEGVEPVAEELVREASPEVKTQPPVRVKQEPPESLSFLERQARCTQYIQNNLTMEALNGEGFLPLTYTTQETPNSYSSLSTVSPMNPPSSSPHLMSPQESLLHGHYIPQGAKLFLALENGQIDPDEYYIKGIQPSQRRQLMLQSPLLTSLIYRHHMYTLSPLSHTQHLQSILLQTPADQGRVLLPGEQEVADAVANVAAARCHDGPERADLRPGVPGAGNGAVPYYMSPFLHGHPGVYGPLYPRLFLPSVYCGAFHWRLRCRSCCERTTWSWN